MTQQFAPGLPDHLDADLGALAFEGQTLFHRQQNLADAEKPDHRDQKIEALEQIRHAIGHAQLAGDRVHADRRQRKAQHHRGKGLGRCFLAHAHEAAEGEQLHRKEFRWTEFQRKSGQHRCQESDQQDRKERADKGRCEGRGERLRRPPLLRHGKAIEGGCHRPGLARNVEENRGDRPAEQCTPVDARQHDDRRGRVHREGQRQQDRHAVGTAQAGQHADQHTQQDADHHVADVRQGEGHGKAVAEIEKFLHDRWLASETQQLFKRAFGQGHQKPPLKHRKEQQRHTDRHQRDQPRFVSTVANHEVGNQCARGHINADQ